MVGMPEHVNMCVGDPVLVHNVRGKSQPGTVVQQLPTPPNVPGRVLKWSKVHS